MLAAGQGRQLLERAGIDTSAVLEQEPGAPPAAPKDQQPTQRSSRPNPNRSERAHRDAPEATKDAPKDAAPAPGRPTPNEREANARSAAETHATPTPAPAQNQPTAITRSAP